MNIFKSFFAGLVIAAAASAAASTTINFDNLDGSGNEAVPDGYGGLNWTNFYVFDAFDDVGLKPSGYDVAWVSQNNVAFSAFPNDRPTETISSDTLFNLNSAYLTSVWRDSLHVEVNRLPHHSWNRDADL